MRDLTLDETHALERILDKAGLQAVLEVLSEICGAKAEHVESNWQDKALARRWAMLEGAIGCLVPNAQGL